MEYIYLIIAFLIVSAGVLEAGRNDRRYDDLEKQVESMETANAHIIELCNDCMQKMQEYDHFFSRQGLEFQVMKEKLDAIEDIPSREEVNEAMRVQKLFNIGLENIMNYDPMKAIEEARNN